MTSTGVMTSIPGLFTAAGCIFEVKIVDVGCHAAFSKRTVDPLLTTLLAILPLQQPVSREIDPLHSKVLSITYVPVVCALNMISSYLKFGGTLRSHTTESVYHFRQRLKAV